MGAVKIIIPQKKYENDDAVDKVINYICRLGKPELIRGVGVYPFTVEDMIREFYIVKRFYKKEDGKQIFHIVFSFEKYLFTAKECVWLGYKIAEYWGNERQVVFAVHDDTDHLHIHMGINTVAYTNGNYKAFYPLEEIKNYVEPIVQNSIYAKWFKAKMYLDCNI